MLRASTLAILEASREDAGRWVFRLCTRAFYARRVHEHHNCCAAVLLAKVAYGPQWASAFADISSVAAARDGPGKKRGFCRLLGAIL
jgi:hypothetical protein